MSVTPEAALKNLKNKQIAPLFLLMGDEPFYLEKVMDALEETTIPVAERSFNQFVLFGKDHSVVSLMGYAKRYPMLADRQLVLVKEAQGLAGLDAKESTRLLEEYARTPMPSTVLVLCFKELVDERKSWVKAFEKNGIVVASRKLYESKIPDWIAAYCHERGAKVSKSALMMLAEYVGSDLKRMANETDKILLNLQAGQPITAEVVELYSGISKEYNSFEFQKALFIRDTLKANRIAAYFASSPKNNPLQPILTVLYNSFSKLLTVYTASDPSEKGLALQLGVNPYFVKDYLVGAKNYPFEKTAAVLHTLRTIDARSKGVDAGTWDEGSLLQELVYEILH